jgi:3-dehydroquinate synthase
VDVPFKFVDGEPARQSWSSAAKPVLRAIKTYRTDRRSYILAIGGSAFLNAIGSGAAIAHRGVPLIRVPTTAPGQMGSRSGIKNALNHFGKKNSAGAFVPPHAVINDLNFLDGLPRCDGRTGIAEAVRVATMRDAGFFGQIERDIDLIRIFDAAAMERLVIRCVELHMEPTAGEDAFGIDVVRPLSLGHWAAHKLEAMSNCHLRYGNAIAIGVAIDSVCAQLEGRLAPADCHRVISLLTKLDFHIWSPELLLRAPESEGGGRVICGGLEEFHQHLGGPFTVTQLAELGRGIEMHELHSNLFERALQRLASDTAHFWISKGRKAPFYPR